MAEAAISSSDQSFTEQFRKIVSIKASPDQTGVCFEKMNF
jgi:hypothetical protein